MALVYPTVVSRQPSGHNFATIGVYISAW
jgi:hypothetical protein